jgi:hypothetical protein
MQKTLIRARHGDWDEPAYTCNFPGELAVTIFVENGTMGNQEFEHLEGFVTGVPVGDHVEAGSLPLFFGAVVHNLQPFQWFRRRSTESSSR